MLRTADRFRLEASVETPVHLDEATHLALNLLNDAARTPHQLPDTAVHFSEDTNAYRTYFERPTSNTFHPDILAIHLGRRADWLMTCLTEGVDKVTLVVQSNTANLYLTTPNRIYPPVDISDNEIAGVQFTRQLYNALGRMGLSVSGELPSLHQAS